MQNNEYPVSIGDIVKLAASPAGQRLLQLLQQGDSSALEQAAKKAAAGDMNAAKNALSGLIQDPEVKKLLEELGR